MKKLLLLCNTRSGKGTFKSNIADVVDYYNSKGYEVTLYISQYRGHITEIVRNIGSDYDNIVCSGGDGTLNETVTGLTYLEKKPILGYIPSGSTNDFANTLGLPLDISKAYKVAVDGTPFSIDIGKCNDRFFTYVSAFGVFANVSYETPQNMKNMLGHMAYVLQGVKQITNIPSYRIKVEYDGGCIEDEFALGFVANSKKVGGFRIYGDDDVDLDDGLFEVLLIKKVRTINDIGDFTTGFLTGRFDKELFYCFKTSKIEFKSVEDISWTVDGEFCGTYKQTDISIYNKLITINV